MNKTFVILLFSVFFSFGQEHLKGILMSNFLRGNIYKHTHDVGHLITGHPDGFMLSYNWKTFW